MEAKWWWVAVVGPVLWGSCYWVVGDALAAFPPWWGATARALPAGLVLLATRPGLPSTWWWVRAAASGMLCGGGFFYLVFVSAQRLPSSVAATVSGASPLVLLLASWWLLARRPRAREVALGLLGLAGVVLMVGASSRDLDLRGLASAAAAVLVFCAGSTLTRRWSEQAAREGRDVPGSRSLVAVQMLCSGAVSGLVAVGAEGPPPRLEPAELAAVLYVALAATGVAFVCWTAALPRLGVARVGLIGLMNPLTGLVLGTVLASESLAATQVLGLVLVLGSVLVSHRALSRPGQTGSVGARPRSRRRGSGGQPLRPGREDALEVFGVTHVEAGQQPALVGHVGLEGGVDRRAPGRGQGHDPPPSVVGAASPGDESG